MSESIQPATNDPATGASDKGLATGRVGVLSAAVLAISTVAPGYTLTASLGLIAVAVAFKMPAILIAGFIPMFLTAWAYRELNSDTPDAGSSFTWSTKAFGPYVGWMAGWGLVIATIIVLSNLAAIAVEYFYLFFARAFEQDSIADLAANTWVNIATVTAFIIIATWIASRGVETSEKVQYWLVGFQLIVLVAFAVTAIVKATSGNGEGGASFSLDWFNPLSGMELSAFAIGLTGSIFAFWGWDATLSLGEECKDPQRTPGRSALLCVVSILALYLLVATSLLMYSGAENMASDENQANVFAYLAQPVMGRWAGLLLFMACFASALASLQTTFLPAARTMLAMGAYKAFPSKFAAINPKFLVPSFSTIACGVITAVFYAFAKIASEQALVDTVAALGIMICWYYGITSFACIWYFRHTLFASPRNILYRLICPLLGGAILLVVFAISVKDSLDPANGSGAEIGGIGLRFYLSFGILLLGAVLMLVQRAKSPAFFKGETLRRSTPAS